MDKKLFINPIVSTSQIMFAQTREDPMVEINVIENLVKNSNCIDICLIGSGGDTVCSIIAFDKLIENIGKMDIIDISFDQICLVKLKLALLQKFTGDFNMNFLTNGFQNSNSDRIECYVELLDKLVACKYFNEETHQYWLNNIDMLSYGINQMGRFEILLRTAKIGGIDKCFRDKNLTEIFGKDSTKYSMSKPFAKHFTNILKTYQSSYVHPSENYFYHQMEYDCYSSVPTGDVPLYLQITQPKNIDTLINFYHMDIISHLKNQPNNCYDLIHISNIIDWIEIEKICDLLNEIGRTLRINGKAILRRLNSDISIENIMNIFYRQNRNYSFQLETNINDRSHFYSQVVSITKI